MTKFRMFAGLMSAIMAAFPVSAAQGSAPDREDSIQVGYVIITPVTTATSEGAAVDAPSGLVAFETFGEKKGNSMTPIGVLPSNMAMSAMLFVNTSGRLSRDVGVAIANPSDSTANITLSLKDGDGNELARKEIELAAGNQQAAFVSQMFEKEKAVPKDFTGSLVISSEIPVAMMGLRSHGENYSTLPLTKLDPPAPVPLLGNKIGGMGAVILAHFAVGGGWETEIVLANVNAAPANPGDPPQDIFVRVDLFRQDGESLDVTLNGVAASSFTGITIPPGGVYVLARRNQNGDSEF